MACCGGLDLAEKIADDVSKEGSFARRTSDILAASHQSDNGLIQTDFLVPAMHCHSCISTLEKGLSRLPFVSRVRANLSTRRVSISWDLGIGTEGDGPSLTRAAKLEDAFADLGFEAKLFDLGDDERSDPVGRQLLTALGVAGFAAANIMLLSISVWSGADAETAQLFHLISGVIAVPAVAYAGQPFFRAAIAALRKRRLNMEVPISLAIVLALGMSLFEALTGGTESYFDAAVTLLFFLLVGRTLDHHMRERARGAIARLQNMAPRGANVLQGDGRVAYTPLREIKVGDRVQVAAGERIPLDATIIDGNSDMDFSLVTGENEPVHAYKGTTLQAGVMNLTGPLEIEVTKLVENSFIAEVVELMSHASQGKAKYRRLADRLAEIYAPAVHTIALITFIGWLIYSGDWQSSLYIAITTLIITCPCALGLAVPIVHVVASGKMFEAGVLVKDGAAFEKLNEIDTIVFDKTGTLTLGHPQILEQSPPALDDKSLSLVASLAQRSSHPGAVALGAHLQHSFEAPAKLDNIHEVPGFGIEAISAGQTIRLGRTKWVAEIAGQSSNDKPQDSVSSVMSFAVEGQKLARFFYKDTLRDDAVSVIKALRIKGFDLQILSGDHASVVDDVAAGLGIQTAISECTPQQKIAHIEALGARGKKVLFVGDGINDAPALAAAHAAMAPSSGSDIGQLAADLVFTGKSLSAIPTALDISQRTDRLVRQNFALALAYNAVAIPLAMAGFVTPLLAAIAMSTSSILVVANSLRLTLNSPTFSMKSIRKIHFRKPARA